jgi:ribonuclease J
VPQYQRVQIKRSELFELLETHKAQRVFNETLASWSPNAVILFRPAMFDDLDKARCLKGARAIWSQWDRYLKKPSGEMLLAALAEPQIPLSQAHTRR